MSKKTKRVLFSFLGIGLLVAAIGVFIMGRIPLKAEIVVESQPKADVYVDNKFLGVTPQVFESSNMQVVLKIVPQDEEASLPYETALSLTPQTKTIVRRHFATNSKESTTQILSLTETNEKNAPISIVTNPESAYVFINNEYAGITPLRVDKPALTYSVQVVKSGFQAMHVSLKNSMGHNLTAYFDLAHQKEINSSLSRGTGLEPQMVTILKTPTGYARVHETPSVDGVEIARVLEGREYLFKSYSELNKWIEIHLNASQSGFVTSTYASVSGNIR